MAHAQLLTFGLDDGPSGSVKQYLNIGGNGEVVAWSSTETDTPYLIPTAGTLTNLFISRSSAPGTGTTSLYGVRHNYSDSALTLTLSNSQTSGQNTKKLVLAADDYISLSHTPTLSPASSEAWGSFEFRPDNPDETIMLGSTGDAALPGSGTRYLCLHAAANPATTSFDVGTRVCNVHGGTFGYITKFRIMLDVAPSSSATRTFTIYKNGSTTGITITISGTNTTGSTTGSVNIDDGDELYIVQTSTSSPSASKAWWGIVIEPVVAGEYLLPGCSSGSLSTGGSYEYNRINCGNSAWTATKANRSRMGSSWGHYVIGICLKTSRAPDTLDPTSSNKAYELYLESPSAVGLRAYVLDNATYANSGLMLCGAKRFSTWNVRSLAYNTPAVATAQWCVQMRYLENQGMIGR